DNDRLSARVATMIGAELLVLLSDVEGLYTVPPHNSEATLVEYVEKITPEIEQMGGGSTSQVGTGGMLTKISAAKIATRAGTRMIIASGKRMNPISALDKEKHTLFDCQHSPSSARKQWIASDLSQAGSATIDAGAADAILNNKSLLPVGITSLHGQFDRGDVIEIVSPDGRVIGRGLSNYSVHEAQKIIGRKGSEIYDLLHYDGPENLIHRDDLVLFAKK
ncbi:MAG: glutamate 5-kinase, partial [Planctomycetota bacterium]